MSEQLQREGGVREKLRGCVVVDRNAYYAGRQASIERGEVTWQVRDPDADNGEVYDLFVKRRNVAVVEFEWETPGEVGVHSETMPGRFTRVCTCASLEEAVTVAEQLFPPNPYN